MALTQKRTAALLAAGLIAVPLLPSLLVDATPADDWLDLDGDDEVTVVSADGAQVAMTPPAGWQYRDRGGNRLQLRTDDGSAVLMEVVDLDGRDPDAVTQRLIRRGRIGGSNAALTPGSVSTGDGSLSGRPCTVVIDDLSGSCAFLSDGDVLVSVHAVGTPDDPAPALDDVLDSISRSTS
ncbi:hypothetical protein [Mycolicibacterium goodii]|uniref:hypothetical protein n=1 Tax=Mycolicibacterium goodii TaxID=134601 RepID=UPI001BDD784F|nr:hypothetical protein [Mycolicibacterium goodii]MBU8817037.1 hypothetical protein [Mycolicibacterium goodii]MBU8830890.1 hypothetical protein [Mycolicibacterium goodii]